MFCSIPTIVVYSKHEVISFSESVAVLKITSIKANTVIYAMEKL